MATVINAKLLESLGACSSQVKAFREIFGEEEAPLTKEIAIAYASVFDWSWAAEHLLSEGKFKAYKEADALLWKAYEEAEAPLLKSYEEAEAPLLKAYKEAKAPLWKSYEEANALLFADLYLSS